MSSGGYDLTAPLLIDLFCGSFGWSAGWLELGGRVIGFDLEHESHHGPVPRGAQLVLQDVRTIDGAQFKDASLIVASSPCQEFSYRAMPWKRAKALGPPLLGMELFAQAERIQREAIAAAGHFIPMLQENVRGAQKYVGRARWHYGSFYLWGDVPALMPMVSRQGAMKVGDVGWRRDNDIRPVGFNVMATRNMKAEHDSVKIGGPRGDDWFTHHNRPEFEERAAMRLSVPVECLSCGTGAVMRSDTIEVDLENFRRAHAECVGATVAVGKAEAHDRATKNDGGSWFNVAHNTTSGKGQNPDGRMDGQKADGGWFRPSNPSPMRQHSSKSSARKAASARIAKIPIALARHIAKVYFPRP